MLARERKNGCVKKNELTGARLDNFNQHSPYMLSTSLRGDQNLCREMMADGIGLVCVLDSALKSTLFRCTHKLQRSSAPERHQQLVHTHPAPSGCTRAGVRMWFCRHVKSTEYTHTTNTHVGYSAVDRSPGRTFKEYTKHLLKNTSVCEESALQS